MDILLVLALTCIACIIICFIVSYGSAVLRLKFYDKVGWKDALSLQPKKLPPYEPLPYYDILDKDNPVAGYYFYTYIGWEIARIYESATGWRVIITEGGDFQNLYLKDWTLELHGPIAEPWKWSPKQEFQRTNKPGTAEHKRKHYYDERDFNDI